MAHEIVIPRLGWSMEEGTFVRWLKRDGERIRRGDMLFELEGEKALQEIEAVDEGILRIPPDAPAEGTVLPVGKVLAYLVAEGEALPWEGTPEPAESPPNSAEEGGREDIAPPKATVATPAETRGPRGPVSSPRARRIAKELGIDWTRLTGTGAGGRIRERDIQAAAASARNDLHIPLSARRRAIAERMLAARQQIVPVTLTTRTDATRLVALRAESKARGDDPVPTYQDVITKLVAELLKRHRSLAGRRDGDAIVLPSDDRIDIGMAVDCEEGLLVPVIRDCVGLSLAALAAQSRELAGKARGGKITAAEMQGGVFTITNLGGFGIDAFTPVIHYPEAAILGLGAIRTEPIVTSSGQVASQPQITLSLTFDHCLIDGAPAARFLQELAAAIAAGEICDSEARVRSQDSS